MTSTPASRPAHTVEARVPTTRLMVQLREVHMDLLRQPVPRRLIEIVRRFPQV
jgi:hypothetical protein